MLHEIKIQEPFADAILDGRKKFEVRLNDRGYQTGDEIIFVVMNGGLKHLCHKLDGKRYIITYILSGWGIENGHVVFGIEEAEREPVYGAWLETETSYADGVEQHCRCSVCNILSRRPLGNFCKWCGADMRGEER